MPQVESKPTAEDVKALCYYEVWALERRLNSGEVDWPSVRTIAAGLTQAAAAMELGKVEEARDVLVGRNETTH